MGTTSYKDKLGQPQKSINNERQPDSGFVFPFEGTQLTVCVSVMEPQIAFSSSASCIAVKQQ